jgi:hypothetical protein
LGAAATAGGHIFFFISLKSKARLRVRVGWGGVLLTALVDDVEGGVGDVVVFEEVFGRAGEGADEDRVVLW